jgi:hypothetical protein
LRGFLHLPIEPTQVVHIILSFPHETRGFYRRQRETITCSTYFILIDIVTVLLDQGDDEERTFLNQLYLSSIGRKRERMQKKRQKKVFFTASTYETINYNTYQKFYFYTYEKIDMYKYTHKKIMFCDQF